MGKGKNNKNSKGKGKDDNTQNVEPEAETPMVRNDKKGGKGKGKKPADTGKSAVSNAKFTTKCRLCGIEGHLMSDCPKGIITPVVKKVGLSSCLASLLPLTFGGDSAWYTMSCDSQLGESDEMSDCIYYYPVDIAAYMVGCKNRRKVLYEQSDYQTTTYEQVSEETMDYVAGVTIAQAWLTLSYNGLGTQRRNDLGIFDIAPKDLKQLFGIESGVTTMCSVFAEVARDFLSPRLVMCNEELQRWIPVLLIDHDAIPQLYSIAKKTQLLADTVPNRLLKRFETRRYLRHLNFPNVQLLLDFEGRFRYSDVSDRSILQLAKLYIVALRSYINLEDVLNQFDGQITSKGLTYRNFQIHIAGKFGLPMIGETLAAYVLRRDAEEFAPRRRLGAWHNIFTNNPSLFLNSIVIGVGEEDLHDCSNSGQGPRLDLSVKPTLGSEIAEAATTFVERPNLFGVRAVSCHIRFCIDMPFLKWVEERTTTKTQTIIGRTITVDPLEGGKIDDVVRCIRYETDITRINANGPAPVMTNTVTKTNAQLRVQMPGQVSVQDQLRATNPTSTLITFIAPDRVNPTLRAMDAAADGFGRLDMLPLPLPAPGVPARGQPIHHPDEYLRPSGGANFTWANLASQFPRNGYRQRLFECKNLFLAQERSTLQRNITK